MAPTRPQPVNESNPRWWCPWTHLNNLWKRACEAEAEIQDQDLATFQARVAIHHWRVAHANANQADADLESNAEPRVTEQERFKIYAALISHLNRQPRVYSLKVAISKEQESADTSASSVAAAASPSAPEERRSPSPRPPSPREEPPSSSFSSSSSSSSSSFSSVTASRPSRPLFFWQNDGLLAPPTPEPDYEGEDPFADFDGVYYQGD